MPATVTHDRTRASADSAGALVHHLPDWARAAFDPCDAPADAEMWTRTLTASHAENFPVISLLLPRHLRQDFCNIYAFCRIADDLGDELAEPARAQQALTLLRERMQEIGHGAPTWRLGAALAGTIRRHDIPLAPFLDLLDAFQQDQVIREYERYEDLLDYCRRSANPVGRLVLYVCGYRDTERQRLADCTCTALQLANFWQDVRRDLDDLGRIYLPRDSMDRFGVTRRQLVDGRCDRRYRDLVRFEVARTERLFDEGDKLLPLLTPATRRHIALFGQAGRGVLAAIRRQNYDTLTRRPVISRGHKARLIARALLASLLGRLGHGGASA